MSSDLFPVCLRAADSARQFLPATDVLGVNAVQQHFGVTYTADQLAALSALPFSDDILRACAGTHVLVAGAPLSVNDVRKLASDDFYDTDWYKGELFANDTKVSVRWYLLRKEAVPESRGKTFAEQTALLKEEEVPFACEVTYMVILYWLTRREHLLPDVYVRCQDTDSDGRRVVVGGFDSVGFIVSFCWGGIRNDNLGLASSVPPRKS